MVDPVEAIEQSLRHELAKFAPISSTSDHLEAGVAVHGPHQRGPVLVPRVLQHLDRVTGRVTYAGGLAIGAELSPDHVRRHPGCPRAVVLEAAAASLHSWLLLAAQ